MHLFIIHQFPDLDTFTPIIYKLDSKAKGIVKILSVYPVQDFRKYELVKFLIKGKIKYYSLSDINLKNYYDNWGSRVYAFYNDENNIMLNFQSAKTLGANYVISKFPIKNNRLKIICNKCNNSKHFFLYEIL